MAAPYAAPAVRVRISPRAREESVVTGFGLRGLHLKESLRTYTIQAVLAGCKG